MADLEKLERHRIALRYWLLGRNYHAAAKAMDYAEHFHSGTRKDGVTPEFSHQIAIANYVRTLEPWLLHPEDTLTTVFLHDVCEDYDVGFEEIETRFGRRVAEATRLVTKKHRGQSIPYEIYFPKIGENPIASIAKGADRVHNLQTSLGVFTPTKQDAYAAEVETWFLPMLKQARRLFPEQTGAYENLKHVLESQVEMIRFIRQGAAA